MTAARYFCLHSAYNELLIRPTLNLRRTFSVSKKCFVATSWMEQKPKYGARSLSSQQAPAKDHSSRVVEHRTVPEAENNNPLAAPDASVDWFGNRYLDKSHHAKDGLDPNDWLLLYQIDDEKRRDRLEYSLYGIALGAIACGTFLFVGTCIRRDDNPFRIAPGFLLGGFMCIMYATRLRRYRVVRLYARRYEQEEWERWRFEQLVLPPSYRSVQAPTRHYRIIWTNLFHKPRMFAYNSRQVSDWVHRKSWMSRALNGNFLVLGRPWALHPEFFEEPPDYIFVRRY